ncbi:efflux RND transporter periplasmic adaptor subunit [Sulfurimonas autotrophica]|nr:HlyD family efflux transporter periplasmic adaptor subunit [Sulfurimonas autotrophica]
MSTMSSTIEVNGKVISKSRYALTAKISGILHWKISQNSTVAKGDIIALVTNKTRDKKLQYLHNKLSLQTNELNFFKTKLQTSLEKYKMGVASKNSYLSDKIAYEHLKEIYHSTLNEYNLLLLEQKNALIKAPHNGVLTNFVSNNSYINYGTTIAMLLDENNYVKLFVDSSYAVKIKKEMQVQLQSSYKNCFATIVNILPKTSNNLMELIAKPAEKLPLNLQLTAKIILKNLNGILIAKEAIVLVDNRPAVYLIDKNNIAHLAFIEIQKDMLQNALIKNTLPKDARVALKNAYMLHDNLRVSVK